MLIFNFLKIHSRFRNC